MNNARVLRHRVVAATATIVLALTASCSGSSSSTPSAGAGTTGAVAGNITYSWWGAAARNKKTQAVVDLFKAAHPGVVVQTETSDFTSYFQKRNVEAAAKNLPCVPQMQARQLTEYTSRKALLPLDDLVNSKAIDVSGIPKNVLDTGRGTDGKLYMVPTGAAYDGFMYNDAMVQKAGVGELKPGYTWEDWQAWLLAAQKKLPSGVAAASLDAGVGDVFISYTASHGEQMFDKDGQLGFSKQTLTDYWNMWEKLRKAGATVSAQATAELGSSAAQDQSFILQGKSMSANTPGNWMGTAQPLIDAHGGGTLMMATHPYGPKGIGNVLITSGLSIAANCSNVPTAASFVNFFTNDAAGAKVFASDNGAVTVSSLLKAQQSDPATNPGVKTYLKVYDGIVAAGAPAIIYPAGYTSVFSDLFSREYQNISFGKISVPAAVDDFFNQAKATLTK